MHQGKSAMGSVYVNWEGTCRDRGTQQELVRFLRQLADRSVARIQGPQIARPAFLEAMTTQRDQNTPILEPVRVFDQEITGHIVLDPCLARNGDSLFEDVQRTRIEMVSIDAGGMKKNEPFCLNLGSDGAQWCLRIPRLQVYGIDLRLFDPRGLYPHADRVSFVFIDSAELPALRGCIAQLENQQQCQIYGSDVIRLADWYVSAPTVHLRYYLEEWTDMLLSWVKYFFVSDLHYHRYEPLSNYEPIRETLQETCGKHGRQAARQLAFDLLLTQFDENADEWIRRVGEM
jgi:hypothetical protein